MSLLRKNYRKNLETTFSEVETEHKKLDINIEKPTKFDFRVLGNPQTIESNGKIHIPKWGWGIRFGVIVSLVLIIGYVLSRAIQLGDPFMIHSTILPIHSILLLVVGWFFYRNTATGKVGNELVSVIIPVYNQVSMIRSVINAISLSSYKNLEIIAVNDGSTDGTKKILDELASKYSNLKVIHNKNQGKRKAVGTGFASSKGKYLIFIDSDSIIDPKAIEELLKSFNSDKKIGAVVANAKPWNNKKNLLTKLQDIWYDVQFNIHKSCESKFGTVICCSGCMCGYRREAISEFIPQWIQANVVIGDDRELTSFVIAKPWSKLELLSAFAQKRLDYSCNFDDAEDRILTAQSLIEWKTVYVSSAVVYTDVPEKVKGFLKQQIRWKKGYLRAQLFVSAFFYQKNPLIALIFYLEFMSSTTLPLMIMVVLFYEPIIMKQYWFTAFFVLSQLLIGLVEGTDSKLRNPKSITWKYKPIMNLFTTFVVSWMLIPAIITLKKNEWGTR